MKQVELKSNAHLLPVKRGDYSRAGVVGPLAVKEGDVPCECTPHYVKQASVLGSAWSGVSFSPPTFSAANGFTGQLVFCCIGEVRTLGIPCATNRPGCKLPIGALEVKALKYIGLVVGLSSCGGQASQQPEGNRQAVERGTQVDSGVSPTSDPTAISGETSAPVDLDRNACRELSKVPSEAPSEAKQSPQMCDSDAELPGLYQCVVPCGCTSLRVTEVGQRCGLDEYGETDKCKCSH